MKTALIAVMIALSVRLACAEAPPREEWYEGLHLENAVAQAQLILAAQVEEVTEIKMISGGKGEGSTLQVRFKPVRVLKGVFARSELVLGTSELVGYGGYGIAGSLRAIKAGQVRLLFLGRNESGYLNINGGDHSLDQAFPPLAAENDPLLQGVTDLLAAHAEPDRVRRVAVLTGALDRSTGPASVALLSAVARRSLLAAQQPGSAAAILRHLGDASPAVRRAAASTIRALLEEDYLAHPELRDQATTALAGALTKEGPLISVRAALLQAIGKLGAVHDPALAGLLDFTAPLPSIAERDARIEAAGELRLTALAEKLAAYAQTLPLDVAYQDPTEIALARLDPAQAAALIEKQAGAKIAAGLKCEAELHAAAALPDPDAVNLLVRLGALPLETSEHRSFVGAAVTIASRSNIEPLVEPLSHLLAPDKSGVLDDVILLLLHIGTPSAAQALVPQLAKETDLERKLQIAEVLGKNGIRDGYPYAIEHVSESHLTEIGVGALAAMNDPRTSPEMRKILESSNDEQWNAAAIRVLGATGAKDLAPKFLAMLGDWKNPLAPAALIALADLGEPQALPKIHEALAARGDEIVIAGARAARRLLAHPGMGGEEIRQQMASLLTDSSASETTRAAALETLQALDDPLLSPALALAVRDAHLENSALLQSIERLLRERKVRLPQ